MPASCARCGAENADGRRFCVNCGLELEVHSGDTAIEQLPADEPGQVPVKIVRAEPRLVRAVTTPLHAIRESSLGRETARAADRALAGVDVAFASLAARSHAGRELRRLRRNLAESMQRREFLLRDLGAAVYRGDEQATERVKTEIRLVDESMEETRKMMEEIPEQAEERVRATRLEVQQTQIVQPEVPEPYPPPGEADPPQQPDVPEPYPPPGELDPPVPPDLPEPSPEREPGQS